MTDQNEQEITPSEPPPPATMAAEAESDAGSTAQPQQQQQQDDVAESTKKLEKMNISFSIWPPSQRTREAVINRLIETLSSPSVLSKRYGTIPAEEAGGVARRIEDEAFAATSGSSVSADDDGIEILQAYSREISKRMLDTVKSRSSSSGSSSQLAEEDAAATATPTATATATPTATATATPTATDASEATGDEDASVKTES